MRRKKAAPRIVDDSPKPPERWRTTDTPPILLRRGVGIQDQGGNYVGVVEAERAELAAAAPELLEALGRCVDLLDVCEYEGRRVTVPPEVRALLVSVRAMF